MVGSLACRGYRTRDRILGESLRTLLAVVLAVLLGSLVGLARTGSAPWATATASTEVRLSARPEIAQANYRVNPANPAEVAFVSFDLRLASGQAAQTVSLRLTGEGGDWHDCHAVGSGNTWACATPGATVAAMDSLTVLAR